MAEMDRFIFEIPPENEIADYAANGTPHSLLQSESMVNHGSLLPIGFSDLPLEDPKQPPDIMFWFQGVTRVSNRLRNRQFKCTLCGRREFRYFFEWLDHWKADHREQPPSPSSPANRKRSVPTAVAVPETGQVSSQAGAETEAVGVPIICGAGESSTSVPPDD